MLFGAEYFDGRNAGAFHFSQPRRGEPVIDNDVGGKCAIHNGSGLIVKDRLFRCGVGVFACAFDFMRTQTNFPERPAFSVQNEAPTPTHTDPE